MKTSEGLSLLALLHRRNADQHDESAAAAKLTAKAEDDPEMVKLWNEVADQYTFIAGAMRALATKIDEAAAAWRKRAGDTKGTIEP